MIQLNDGNICNPNNNFWFNPTLLGRCYGKTQRQKFCTLVHSAVALFLPNSTDRLPLTYRKEKVDSYAELKVRHNPLSDKFHRLFWVFIQSDGKFVQTRILELNHFLNKSIDIIKITGKSQMI